MSVIEQLDKDYEDAVSNEKFEESLKANECSDDPEVIWRLARIARILSDRHTDAEGKKKYAARISEIAKKGLEKDENNSGCNKWFAMGLMQAAGGPQEKMKNVHIVKEHFQKAVDLNPDDPHAHHVLGTWYFNISDLPWLMRKMLSAIQKNPPSATYEQALAEFEKAEEIKPGFFGRNYLLLGKTYLRLKDKAKAKEYFQKAQDFPCKYPVDEEVKKEAEEQLKGL